ncbi:Ank-repeat mbp1 [Fusarium mexicanum]|uniref:Ank-repeat mbp1 n=1 Tax=Fusarium mexicanum TaxID=751941 RepID=A0A8H5IX01_9HYPO|nr:Ank-repeat mbp1 [Fusarium mexicanum]
MDTRKRPNQAYVQHCISGHGLTLLTHTSCFNCQPFKKKASGSQKEPGNKYTIVIKDFAPIANYIAAQRKPRIQVPDSFTTTIDRVIYERSSFRRLKEAG